MFSAAFNNAECLEGAADQKTGSYSFRHIFGTVQANGKFGPKCNLTMSFGFLSTMAGKNSTGLGNGWSFKLGGYSNKTLTLNTGESHQVLQEYYHDKAWKLSHKLKGLEVVRTGTDEPIQIKHKNGDLEVMEVHSQDAILTRFTSANGRFLRFKYRLSNGYWRLVGVYDSDSNTKPLATVDYDVKYRVKVTTHPGKPDECVTELFLNDAGMLYKIKLPDSKEILLWPKSLLTTSPFTH